MVARPGEAIMGNGHTKALTSSLIRPALGSDPRFRARLPDRAGNPQRAGGAHGSLVPRAVRDTESWGRGAPRQRGAQKGVRGRGGRVACFSPKRKKKSGCTCIVASGRRVDRSSAGDLRVQSSNSS